MIFRIIAAVMFGIGLGIFISSVVRKQKEYIENSKIEILEDLLEVSESYEKELRDKVNYYKNGMNETLEQNINLQRRLNNGKTSRV